MIVLDDSVLLVSGAGDRSTGGGLCSVDGETAALIDRVSTAGITVIGNRLARLLRVPLSTWGGELVLYDQRGISNYLRIDELTDAHYIAWDGRCLIVSSTGNNSLLWIDLTGQIVRQWTPPDVQDDSWHLNDVLLVDGRLYACAFGKYKDYRGYKDHLSAGHGFVFEVETGRTVLTGLCAPHSPRFANGAWYVCNSLENSVVKFDAQGRRLQETKLRSFTRGMAVTDEYVAVGESAHRASGSLEGSVAILRRQDLQLIKRIHVPFPEVSEVALVPRALAEGARIGFRTNPLRTTESDQLFLFRELGLEPNKLWAISDQLLPAQCRSKVEADIPSSMSTDELLLLDCRVQNISDTFFCSEIPFPVYLSYRWHRTDGAEPLLRDGIRTALPGTMSPGVDMLIRVEIRAPEIPGIWKLSISLLQEYVFWFDDLSLANGARADVTIRHRE